MHRQHIVPYAVFQLMNDENEMELDTCLSSYDFPNTGTAQVLIQRPERLYVEPMREKDTPPPVPTLDDNILAFVNRNDAVRALQAIHSSCSDFGGRYIEQCKLSLLSGSFDDKPGRRTFLKEELCACQTIHVKVEHVLERNQIQE
ncbi:hypothetical protein PRNP1_009784 [Phytophthora ramorum]